MALKYDMRWHFTPPSAPVPNGAIDEFFAFAKRVAAQGGRQDVLETFKEHFAIATDRIHNRSSSEAWARADLRTMMDEASENAPRFIEAFSDSCELIKRQSPSWVVPDAILINQVMQKHKIPFELHPPDLLFAGTGGSEAFVDVPTRPASLADQAVEIFQKSLQRSERSLSEGRGREAVQELIWLLESVTTTAFKGVDTDAGKIGGTYFNKIVQDLRKKKRGTTFDQALDWATRLHGYLSSPTGGGVRHGLDLNTGVAMSPREARLYANLIRSYLAYLLAEHEAMTSVATDQTSDSPRRQ
ncbi:hypothetical protein [Dyella lutea]|uniref:Uncharacterized protein n=1 Tax=Dyella lutea TaxID=2950441 RepID=A0ABT1FCP0_9GAMM|nr:hypothetical protein [Dyella lutea]MCP1375150.1 hypothetical protein [Dyella lutea]